MDNKDLLYFDPDLAVKKTTEFIRRYTIDLNRDGAIVGLSGGLDSCVTLKLCSEAVGPENVRAVIIPERDSDPGHMRDAKSFARSLSIKYTVKSISPVLWWLGVYRLYPPTFIFSRRMQARFVKKSRKRIAEELKKDIYMANLGNEKHKELNKGKAFYRIKHRLRSSLLFYYSELFNMLFVGTSNKTEVLTGFFVKYGDNIADIMPLSFLYKTQVKILASHLGIENRIINKRPSPDLIPGIIDEDMLGLDYGKLDRILIAMENNQDDLQIMDYAGASQEEVDRARKMMLSSEYLRTWPLHL